MSNLDEAYVRACILAQLDWERRREGRPQTYEESQRAVRRADQIIARIKAEAWDEGAEHAWRSTGEGFNGEYVGGHGTHDGAISFRQVRAEDDRDDNPYREEQNDG